MQQIRHLKRAPIVEALLNFQANATSGWQQGGSSLQAAWPHHSKIEELHQLPIDLAMQPPVAAQQELSARRRGWLLRSPDEPTVHQVRPDGYTFSRLAPYTDWKQFIGSAMAGWKRFQAAFHPDPLHAVMVRFINRLEFPVPKFRLGRFFTTSPKAPPDLNWQFHDFNQQFIYAVPRSPCAVQSILAPAFTVQPTEIFAFVLDIQVMLKDSLPTLGGRVEDVLAEMHKLKNQAFFGLLTEEAIRRYV